MRLTSRAFTSRAFDQLLWQAGVVGLNNLPQNNLLANSLDHPSWHLGKKITKENEDDVIQQRHNNMRMRCSFFLQSTHPSAT